MAGEGFPIVDNHKVQDNTQQAGKDKTTSPFHDELASDRQAPKSGGQSDKTASGDSTDKTRVTDKAEGANAADSKPANPYNLVDHAVQTAGEIDTLNAQGRKPNEVIVVSENGQVRQMTVADRLKELKTSIKNDLDEAKRAAGAIRLDSENGQPGLNDMLKDVQDRQKTTPDGR